MRSNIELLYSVAKTGKHRAGLRENLYIFKHRLEKHVWEMLYICLMLPPGNGVDQRASQIPSLLWSLLSQEPSVLAVVRAVRIWCHSAALSEWVAYMTVTELQVKPYLWSFQKISLSVLFALNTRCKIPAGVIWPWDKRNPFEIFILLYLSD